MLSRLAGLDPLLSTLPEIFSHPLLLQQRATLDGGDVLCRGGGDDDDDIFYKDLILHDYHVNNHSYHLLHQDLLRFLRYQSMTTLLHDDKTNNNNNISSNGKGNNNHNNITQLLTHNDNHIVSNKITLLITICPTIWHRTII